jgi:ketosteroid isomerase-like protein
MSQENVEIVRLAYEAWNRDDIDALLTFFHDDIEYVFLSAIREGRAVEIREYGTKEEALEAAGLSE